MSRNNRYKLTGEWREIIKEHLATYTCIYDSRLQLNYCPKGRFFYHHTIARCQFHETCRRYLFVIKAKPKRDEEAIVYVSTNRPNIHHTGKARTAGVRKLRRQSLAAAVYAKGTTLAYNEQAANAVRTELEQGNRTSIPSKESLRKMKQEHRKSNYFSRDPLDDLDQLADNLFTAASHAYTEHYIRTISKRRDYVYIPCFSKYQLQAYIDATHRGTVFLYLDATGSVVKRPTWIQEGKIFYYALVMKSEPSFPIAEMYTTDHSIVALNNLLTEFWHEVRKIEHKPRAPQKIETVFSWPMMLTVPVVFNQMGLSGYIETCYNICDGHEDLPKNLTVLHICAAHMIHATARRLNKKIPQLSKDVRRVAMRSFAVLQNCTTMEQAGEAYEHIYHLFSDEGKSARTEDAKAFLEKFNFEEVGGTEEEVFSAKTNYFSFKDDHEIIKNSSKFTSYFARRISEAEDKHPENPPNPFDNPTVFQVLTHHMHLYPLWSGVMLNRIGKQRDTNAVVESWFRFVKSDCLHHSAHAINHTVRNVMAATTNACAGSQNVDILKNWKLGNFKPKELKNENWSAPRSSKHAVHYASMYKVPEISEATAAHQPSKSFPIRKVDVSCSPQTSSAQSTRRRKRKFSKSTTHQKLKDKLPSSMPHTLDECSDLEITDYTLAPVTEGRRDPDPDFFKPPPIALTVFVQGVVNPFSLRELGLISREQLCVRTTAQTGVLDDEHFQQSIGAIYAPTKAYQGGRGHQYTYATSSKVQDKPLKKLRNIGRYKGEVVQPERIDYLSQRYLYSSLLDSKRELDSDFILTAMSLIRQLNQDIPGLLPTDLVQTLDYCISTEDRFLQIIHTEMPQHWLVISCSNVDTDPTMTIYDSLFSEPLASMIEQIASLLRCSLESFKVKWAWCPKQSDGYNCGVHALANLTQLFHQPEIYNNENWIWSEQEMRTHLLSCFDNFTMTTFPRVDYPRDANRFPNGLPERVYEVHCICRQPCLWDSWFGGLQREDQWVKCLRCHQYFHPACVNSTAMADDFRCVVCTPLRKVNFDTLDSNK